MSLHKNMVLLFFLPGLVFNTCIVHARNINGTAEATLVIGHVSIQKKNMADTRWLHKGDLIMPGDRVLTKKNARIEIRLPDNSILRFDGKTTFTLESAFFNKRTNERKIKTILVVGKVWAHVTKCSNGMGYFNISTSHAVVNASSSVFRMNIYRDLPAEIKVYKGDVAVRNREETMIRQTHKSVVKEPAPQVPNPSKQKDWTHHVSSMHQMVIWKDGLATKPFRFSAKSDSSRWVMWNRKLDEKISNQ